MNSAWASKSAAYLRGATPVLITLSLMLPFTLPLGLPNADLLPAVMAMTAAYYWSIYRPELMPIGAVFLIGLLHDLLSSGPLGAMALALLALHLLAVSQRRALAGTSFWIIWLGYVVISPVIFCLLWLMLMLFHLRPLTPQPFLFQYLISAALYPVIAEFFNMARTRVLKI